MQMRSYHCPNCNASLEVEEGRTSIFCSYCGSRINLEDPNSITFTYRKVDEARIREATASENVKIREIESKKSAIKATLIIGALSMGILSCMLIGLLTRNALLTRKLEKKMEEIQVDIAKGDYDSALIKANTLRFYDGGDGGRREAYWNQQRESIISTIENKKKEATKTSQEPVAKADVTTKRAIEQTTAAPQNEDASTQLSNTDKESLSYHLSKEQYALVDNPSEAYVISCLQRVDGITEIAAATEENDPNGHLGKAGGYTAAVYFSHQKVDQSSVYGDTLIDKGTDAGGQIEVYSKPEDAEKRNDYLATFDGGVFASGSHCVIGTVVVRTSDELTATQQKELEESVIAELLNIDAATDNG